MREIIQLDQYEEKIVKELIRDARLSDNQIAKNTRIPVMTVNRKRKQLEAEGVLSYMTRINRVEEGKGRYHAQQLYILKFKLGVTRKRFLEKPEVDPRFRQFFTEHIVESYLGEQDGHLALMLLLEADSDAQLVEVFNGKILPIYTKIFGENAVDEITTCKISLPLRFHHNYMPEHNMQKGKMKESWDDDWIYLGAPLDVEASVQKKLETFQNGEGTSSKKNF